MNRHQKIAWCDLISASVAFVIVGLTIFLSTPTEFRHRISQLMILGGFISLGNLFVREKFNKIEFDERDQLIQKRANLFAYSAFWIVWASSTIVATVTIGPENTIPVIYLPLSVLVGAIIIVLVRSTAILVQYGWGQKDGGE